MWLNKAGLRADAPQPALPRAVQAEPLEYPRYSSLRSSGAPLRVYTAQAERFARKPGAMVATELKKLDLWDHLKAA